VREGLRKSKSGTRALAKSRLDVCWCRHAGRVERARRL